MSSDRKPRAIRLAPRITSVKESVDWDEDPGQLESQVEAALEPDREPKDTTSTERAGGLGAAGEAPGDPARTASKVRSGGTASSYQLMAMYASWTAEMPDRGGDTLMFGQAGASGIRQAYFRLRKATIGYLHSPEDELKDCLQEIAVDVDRFRNKRLLLGVPLPEHPGAFIRALGINAGRRWAKGRLDIQKFERLLRATSDSFDQGDVDPLDLKRRIDEESKDPLNSAGSLEEATQHSARPLLFQIRCWIAGLLKSIPDHEAAEEIRLLEDEKEAAFESRPVRSRLQQLASYLGFVGHEAMIERIGEIGLDRVRDLHARKASLEPASPPPPPVLSVLKNLDLDAVRRKAECSTEEARAFIATIRNLASPGNDDEADRRKFHQILHRLLCHPTGVLSG